MPYPPITPLPTPPSRSQSPETFSADADAFLGALPDFQSDANALGSYLDGVAAAVDADAASADIDAAAAAASQAAAALSESNAAASEANAAASEANAAASEAAAAISEANAAASELAAASSAAEAEAIVAGVGFKDVVFINAAMSPYTVTSATNGKLLACDTTAGPIVVNLPLISSITTPYTFGAKKTTSDVNALTINCAGSDTFDDGTASKALTTPSGYTLLPDADLSPDVWAAIGFGGANAGPATSSGLTMSSGKLLGRTTAGAGAIEELPIASYSNPTTAGIAVTDGSAWSTSLIAPTGDIVGTSDAQTLTNKTIAYGSNTITGVAQGVAPTATTGGELRAYEGTNNGSNFVALKAPAALAADRTFVLPATDGTSGQFLKTDGAGNLSFESPSTGGWTQIATTTVGSPVSNITFSNIPQTYSDLMIIISNISHDYGSNANFGIQVSANNGTTIKFTYTSSTSVAASGSMNGSATVVNYKTNRPIFAGGIGNVSESDANVLATGSAGSLVMSGAINFLRIVASNGLANIDAGTITVYGR